MAIKTSWATGDVLASADLTDTLASKTTTALPINAQTSTTYSFSLADSGKTVTASNAAASTYNIPLEATVAWVTATELRLYNIGAGTVTITCTSGTLAGTVTVPQYGFVTLKKTGTNTWYGIAQDKAVATATGLTLITTSSFSAATSVSINNCFSSTYENYKIVYRAVGSSSTPIDLSFRLRVSGADNTTANYYQAFWYSTAASPAPTGAWAPGVTSLALAGGVGDNMGTITADIFAPQAALQTGILSDGMGSGSAAGYFQKRFAFFNLGTQFDGFTFYVASGTMTGNLRVYGYQNS